MEDKKNRISKYTRIYACISGIVSHQKLHVCRVIHRQAKLEIFQPRSFYLNCLMHFNIIRMCYLECFFNWIVRVNICIIIVVIIIEFFQFCEICTFKAYLAYFSSTNFCQISRQKSMIVHTAYFNICSYFNINISYLKNIDTFRFFNIFRTWHVKL